MTASTQDFDNELEILRSRTLVKKVVNAMDLYIQYRVPGSFRDTELYRKSPVKVWVTPEEAEKMGYAQASMFFNQGKLERVTVTQGNEEWTQEVSKLPLVFPTPIGVFTFSAADSALVVPEQMKEVVATVASPTAIAAGFRANLAIVATNRATTIAQLTQTDSQVSRAIDFLNKLIDVYNEEGNNAKMKWLPRRRSLLMSVSD